MSDKGVELVPTSSTEPSKPDDVKIEAKKEELKSVSVSTLLFSHATKGQIVIMWTGYLCTDLWMC